MVKAEETREERMRRKVRKGTARDRDAYVRFRKVTSLPTLIRRRWAARSLPRNAFTLPPGAGFLVLPPGRFPEVDEITAAAQATVAAADMDAKIKTGHKTFLVSLLNQSDLTLDSPFMRLALRPDIVSAVAGYLGVLPILEYINVLCSNHVQEPLSKSQILHCDSDAETQVKIFVLCTEVTTENGPLVILGADSSRRLRARVTLPAQSSDHGRGSGGRTRQPRRSARHHRTAGNHLLRRHEPLFSLRQPHRGTYRTSPCGLDAVHHPMGILHAAELLAGCTVPSPRRSGVRPDDACRSWSRMMALVHDSELTDSSPRTWQIVQARARSAGLAGVSAHSGRRGMATELVRRGAPTTAIQQAGGWKDPQMVAP